MMHPFASVTACSTSRSTAGRARRRIQCLEFDESDPSRGFVRGAKWALAVRAGR